MDHVRDVVYLVGWLSGHNPKYQIFNRTLCRMNSVLPLDKSEMLMLT
jgi:hypothetical protein